MRLRRGFQRFVAPDSTERARDLGWEARRSTRLQAARGLFFRSLAIAALLPSLSLSLSGCLDAPDEDDLWTRLDIESVEPLSHEKLVRGETVSVRVRGSVTYRSIITGAVALEIRQSDNVGYGEVRLEDDRNRLGVLHDVNLILENSRVVSAVSRNVAGWDHLIHQMDFEFDVRLPADSGRGGVYAILYLGEANEVELPNGEEVTVVTAFDFEERHILPTGVELVPE